MIILHGHQLSIVEHEEMRSFAKSLNPEFNMASSIDVEEYSTILFQKLTLLQKRFVATPQFFSKDGLNFELLLQMKRDHCSNRLVSKNVFLGADHPLTRP